MKEVAVSVTNDLSNDQRVQRSIALLQELGFRITFIGRLLPESKAFKPNYRIKRFKLPFRRGFLFYASYNLRLFWHFLWRRYDLYLSNDLDTLWPNYLAARLRGKPLIYDSHEYFTGVPEIQDRPLVKTFWTRLERALLPKADALITVNHSIADLYQAEYGCRPTVVRNIAADKVRIPRRSRAELELPEKAYLLINQGAGINIDRGVEEALLALHQLPEEVMLLLVGKGDVLPKVKALAVQEGLSHRLIHRPPVPYADLLAYTAAADLGLSLDKDTNLNYRYSLPNKLFDYLKAGLPVLGSEVVEVKRLIERYSFGLVVKPEPTAIAQAVASIRQNPERFAPGRAQALAENSWAAEKEKLKRLFQPYV